jgi:exosome complex exonuclease DIS3/RRP44
MMLYSFYRDVYITRDENESPNDRNDRAIRQCCLYYAQHLPKMRIVLLSDDLANVRIAREKGIVAYTCREYVSSLTSKPELIDRLAAKESKEGSAEISEQQVTDLTRKNKTIIFPEHLKLSEVQAGIKAGKFYQGYNNLGFSFQQTGFKIINIV